jgi:hypothetical protein
MLFVTFLNYVNDRAIKLQNDITTYNNAKKLSVQYSEV